MPDYTTDFCASLCRNVTAAKGNPSVGVLEKVVFFRWLGFVDGIFLSFKWVTNGVRVIFVRMMMVYPLIKPGGLHWKEKTKTI